MLSFKVIPDPSMLYGVSVIEPNKFRESGASSYYGFSHNYNISDYSEEDMVTGSSDGSSTVDGNNAAAAAAAAAPVYLQCLTRD